MTKAAAFATLALAAFSFGSTRAASAEPARVTLDRPLSDGRADLGAAEIGRLINEFSYDAVELPREDQITVLESLLRRFDLTSIGGVPPEDVSQLLEHWPTMNEVGRLPPVDVDTDHGFAVTYATLRAYVGLELIRARAALGPMADDELRDVVPRLMYEALGSVVVHAMRDQPKARAEQRLGLRGLKSLASLPVLARNPAVRDQFDRFIRLARTQLATDVEPLIDARTNHRKWRRLTVGSLALGLPLMATLIYFGDVVNRQPFWVNAGGLVAVSATLWGATAWMELRRRRWAATYRTHLSRAVDQCERALRYGVPFSGDRAS